MPQSALTGSRIRERRMLQGLRQSELARAVGISPSYLNLIEHNRRRIGGKLLVDIAGELKVEASLLAEGAEAELIARLSAAAAEAGDEGAETEQAGDLAGRFPGWARLVVAQRRRIEELERAVEVLSDRLTHDPHLAATLHEVLDTVTAIRSTAGILAETREIEPEWRDRFHRNINEDAQRLAEGAQALVGFLDEAGDAEGELIAPQEEFEGFLAASAFHFEALEDGTASPEDVAAGAGLHSASARAQAEAALTRYADDAAAAPLAALREAMEETGPDPLALAVRLGVSPGLAMRRIAALPELEAGLVICDRSGTITFRKPVAGFALPRFGAACPLWPLYQALSRPMVPVRELLGQPGRDGVQAERLFLAHALAEPLAAVDYGREPLYETQMLILPVEREADAQPALVGATCRICSRRDCEARREPSIMSEGV